MDYRKIITIEPGKRGGKPCIRGMRITVQDVLEYLAGGMSEDKISFLPKSENWWAAGETGPCGPDTEIFYWVGESEFPPE